MEIVYLNEQDNLNLEPSCVALGFFDGMHLGHLKLVNKVIEVADQKHLKKGLLTFDVHPRSFLSDVPFKYLMSLEDKIEFIKGYDYDYLFILKFNHLLAKTLPRDFIDNYIIKANIKHVVCGFDFHFGIHGSGNKKFLIENQGNDYEVSIINKLEYEHHKISSSYLRKILTNGEVELAHRLLERPYCVTGKVIHGRENGRKIGFPTINVETIDYILPKNGVYGAQVVIDGNVYLGMANLGYNPTFTALNQASLEVNIFDFDQDVYGKTVTVAFIKHIRSEQKFPSVNDLIEQLKKDRLQIINDLDSFI